MSWFDSSFSFARTALSQAQKSIDKVLDIREDEANIKEPSKPDSPSTSSATSPSAEKPKTSPLFSTSTPKLTGSKTTPSSTHTTETSVVASPSFQSDGFNSTWGGADSLWSTPLSTPPKKKERGTPVQPIKSSVAANQGKEAVSRKKEGPVSSPLLRNSSLSSPLSNSNRASRKVKVHQERQDCESKSESNERGLPGGRLCNESTTAAATRNPASHDRVSGTVEKETNVLSNDGSGERDGESGVSYTPLSHESSARNVAEKEGGEGMYQSKPLADDSSKSTGITSTSATSPTMLPSVSSISGSNILPVQHTASLDTAGHSLGPSATSEQVARASEDVANRENGENKGDEGPVMDVELTVPTDTTDSGIRPEVENKQLYAEKEEDDSITVQAESSHVSQCNPNLPLLSDKERQKLSLEEVPPLMEVSLSPTLDTVSSPLEGGTEVMVGAAQASTTSSPNPSDSPLHLKSPPLPISQHSLTTRPFSPTSPLVPISHHSPTPIPTSSTPHPPSSTLELTTPSSERALGGDSSMPHLLPHQTPQPSHSGTVEEVKLEKMDDELRKCESGLEGKDTVLSGARGDDAVKGEEGGKGEGVGGDSVPVVREMAVGGVDSRSVELDHSPGHEAVQQELERVKRLLEARESRMLETSREMIQLTETNQELQSRLSSAERDLHTSQGGVTELRSEFTKRIGTTEKKLQTICKERDSLKKQLQALTTDHSNQRKSASQELSTLLREKEEQIAGLMKEGENLSKKELQNSNIIKKLKEKNKQNDQLLTAQRQQIEDCEREMNRLKELVKKKEDTEKKYQESLAQLNSIAEQQEKDLTELKSERDDLSDKARSLQTNLDNAYKELSELHKVTAVNKTVAHEALLSAEQTARQELTEVLEKRRVEAHREKETLLLEISELRASVSRCEQQAAWREERMKQEVSDMQQRLQEAEMRNQELSTTISQTTKPFLRQIETLHSAHATQTVNWEKVEASLTQRLVEAQTQLSIAVEKERSSTEKTMTLQSRVTQLEKTNASQRQEKSRLTASLELEKAKAETLEEGQQRDSAKMEAVRASMQQSLEELRKEKEILERQLEYERVRLEAESRKACLESQEKERLRSQLASSLSRGLSRQSSTASTSHTQSEILEKSLVQQMSEMGGEGGGGRGGGSTSTIDGSVFHGRAHPTSASAIEQLQSLLKQREGELANAQTLVSSLERSRAAMANDLAAVSTQNVELTEKVNTIPHLTNKLQELQKDNEALLQMYGEKAERAEELRLDIEDLKEMYRQQIDALTKR